MTAKEAIDFVERHGVVLQSARGPVPSLAEAIAGGPIRGSWWGHPRGKEIYRAAASVCACPDVLVCRLVDGRITFVHRRLWPALVKLSGRFPIERLAMVRDEHTATGAHRSRRVPFPEWVPPDALDEARKMSAARAVELLGAGSVLWS